MTQRKICAKHRPLHSDCNSRRYSPVNMFWPMLIFTFPECSMHGSHEFRFILSASNFWPGYFDCWICQSKCIGQCWFRPFSIAQWTVVTNFGRFRRPVIFDRVIWTVEYISQYIFTSIKITETHSSLTSGTDFRSNSSVSNFWPSHFDRRIDKNQPVNMFWPMLIFVLAAC